MTGFDPEAFLHRRVGHGGAIGLRYHDHGADWATLALPWRAELAGADGDIAIGAIVTMIDVATAMAIWLARGGFGPQATLDLRLDRLRAAVPGRTLLGRGECRGITGPVAFVRGTVSDGDPADPVAYVTGSYMLLDPA